MAKKVSKKKVVKAKKKSVAKSKKVAKSKPAASKKSAKSKKPVVKKKAQKPVKKIVAKKSTKKALPKAKSKKQAAPKKIVAITLAPKKALVSKKPIKVEAKAAKEIKVKSPEPVIEAPLKEVKVKLQKVKEKKIIKAPIIIPQKVAGKPTPSTGKKNEPKGKFVLEFVIRSSPAVLFEFLSSPSGLSEWFADDVNVREDIYTFFWDGSEQQARIIALSDEESIRFQWLDKKDGSYFEFKLVIDELTGDVSLMITDFAENDSEKNSSTLLWQSQIDKLLHVLGSFF